MPKSVNKVARDAATGKFVERGAKIGKFRVMGTNRDGTVIVAPKQKPKNFTERELHRVVQGVKEEMRRSRVDVSS